MSGRRRRRRRELEFFFLPLLFLFLLCVFLVRGGEGGKGEVDIPLLLLLRSLLCGGEEERSRIVMRKRRRRKSAKGKCLSRRKKKGHPRRKCSPLQRNKNVFEFLFSFPADSLDPQLALLLTNAVYFKDAWTSPFEDIEEEEDLVN